MLSGGLLLVAVIWTGYEVAFVRQQQTSGEWATNGFFLLGFLDISLTGVLLLTFRKEKIKMSLLDTVAVTASILCIAWAIWLVISSASAR